VTTVDAAGAPQVRVATKALANAERISLDASPHELGGIMIGWWEGDSTAVVQAMLPVPDHSAGRSHYQRRHSLAQEMLDVYMRTRDDPRCGYVGEWHSHPTPQPPSATDRSALSAIVRQDRKAVALVVLALTRGGEVTSHGLIGRPRWPRRASLEVAPVERMTS